MIIISITIPYPHQPHYSAWLTTLGEIDHAHVISSASSRPPPTQCSSPNSHFLRQFELPNIVTRRASWKPSLPLPPRPCPPLVQGYLHCHCILSSHRSKTIRCPMMHKRQIYISVRSHHPFRLYYKINSTLKIA